MKDCKDPTAPDEEELLRFALDGEVLSTEESQHLELCSNCQQRLATYKNGHAFLVSRLYRGQCPDGTQLSLYCADLLPADERMRIANHLLDCPLCTAEAVDTRQFLADTADRELLPAPPFSLPALGTTARRIFATPVKRQGQLVMRGEAGEAAWPRQYHAESVDLSLHLSRTSSGDYMLLGVITDPAENIEALTGITAELYPAAEGKNEKRTEQPLLSKQIDEPGNIVLSAIPAGEYVMIVHLPGRELVIEGLIIKPG